MQRQHLAGHRTLSHLCNEIETLLFLLITSMDTVMGHYRILRRKDNPSRPFGRPGRRPSRGTLLTLEPLICGRPAAFTIYVQCFPKLQE